MNVNIGWKSAVGVTSAVVGVWLTYKFCSSYDKDFMENRRYRIKQRRKARVKRRQALTKVVDLEMLLTIIGKTKQMFQLTMKDVAAQQRHIETQTKGQFPEAQLRAVLMETLKKKQSQRENKIYEQLGVTEKTVQDAMKKHAENPKIKAFVTWLKKSIQKVSGEDDSIELPKDLTPNKVLTIMEEVNEENTTGILAALASLKKRHNVSSIAEFQTKMKSDPMIQQEFQMVVMKSNSTAQNKVLKAHGIKDPNVLNKAIKTYQHDRNFMQAIQQGQQNMQKRLMAHGLC